MNAERKAKVDKLAAELKEHSERKDHRGGEKAKFDKLIADQILQRWPHVAGPPGVLTDDEVTSLAVDLADRITDYPDESPDENAEAAASWWRSKGSGITRKARALIKELDTRAGLTAAVEPDDIIAVHLTASLTEVIERIQRFLKELNDA